MTPALTLSPQVGSLLYRLGALSRQLPGSFTLTSALCFPALDRPQGLTAVNVTDTSALLLWQPSYATVDGYLVTYSADTGGFLPFLPPVWQNLASIVPFDLSTDASHLAAASKVEHVSGNLVEFEMGSLTPGTRYTVEVQALKDAQKSDSAVTEFTTSKNHRRKEKSVLYVSSSSFE